MRRIKSLGNAILQGSPPLSIEFLQEPFCFLGGDNFTQITSLVNRRVGNQSAIRLELSNDRDYISEVYRSGKAEESPRDSVWVEEGHCMETRNVDDIAEVFCFDISAVIKHRSRINVHLRGTNDSKIRVFPLVRPETQPDVEPWISACRILPSYSKSISSILNGPPRA